MTASACTPFSRGYLHATALLLVGLQVAPTSALAQQKESAKAVSYLFDSILSVDDGLVRLLGGSSWRVDQFSLLLPASDVLLIFAENRQVGLLFSDGTEVVVSHVSGSLVTQSGILTTVVDEMGDGALHETADGSLWEVPNYDRYDTGWWLPPYPVLITSKELYMINIRKMRRVWVTRKR